MVRNARVSHGTQEDRVERPQLLDTIGRHHLPSLDINVATPIKRLPVESESEALSCRFQHTDAFWHHLFPNAVACDDRDVDSSHEATLYPFSADSNGVSVLTSGAESTVLTKAMIFSVLSLGHLPSSPHPRDFVAASATL